MRTRSSILMVAVASVLTIGSLAQAALLQKSIPQNKYGHVDQNSAGITDGANACGPTSVYNSFVYLENQFGVDIIPDGEAASTTINNIGIDMGRDPVTGGTVSAQGMIDGKKEYIRSRGLTSTISVESLMVDPDVTGFDVAQFLFDQLALGQDVEIGFLWSDANGVPGQGGHIVTVSGIDYDTDAGTGTLNIIDPIDGVNITANLTNNGSQQLVIGYTGGGAGDVDPNEDDDNPGDASFGKLAFVAAESYIPEPGTITLFTIMGGSLMLRRSKR